MSHLQQLNKDKKLAAAIAQIGELSLQKKKHIHFHLCNSIMSQQLSTKVAAVFHARFLQLFNGKVPTAAAIAAIAPDVLRGIGLSQSKANYILNVANFFVAQQLTDAKLFKLPNQDVIDLLTQIKGIGKWTVEMILMFAMQREDVFAVDDLGIQQAMCAMYKIDSANKKEMQAKMLLQSKKWIPYRTYACLYLWRYKDGEK
jgi:DNA-3-methyladenine glycosylase II